MDAAKFTVEEANTTFDSMIDGFNDVDWSKLAQEALDFMNDSPEPTAFGLTLVILAFCPWLVVTPALWMAGSGELGPVAGESLDPNGLRLKSTIVEHFR
jgi:hypothetical protein